jgi:hypothetical protein
MSYSVNDMRDGVNLSRLQVTRPLVMHTEVTNLPNRTGFLRFGRNLPVVRFEDCYNDLPTRSAPFVERIEPPFRHARAEELVRIARAESKLRNRLEQEQGSEGPKSAVAVTPKAPAKPSRQRPPEPPSAQGHLFSETDPIGRRRSNQGDIRCGRGRLPIDVKTAWEHLAARQNRITSSLVQHGRADGTRGPARPA